jgi:hypothetical protein
MTIPTESELVPATTEVAPDTPPADIDAAEPWTGELVITPDIVADILLSNNVE